LKKTVPDKIILLIVYFILIILAVTSLFPFFNLFSKAISLEKYVAAGQIFLLPKGFQLDAYAFLLRNEMFLTSFKNSIIIVLLGVMLNMGLTVLTAFPLSRKPFPGQKVIMFLFIFTMFFNGGIIPLYLLLKDLRLTNTIGSLILPSFISVYNLILMRNFYLSIPGELEDSARIDGCSSYDILYKIFIPLSMPAIMTLTLFYAVSHWNSFFNAMMYINDISKQPLQIYLRNVVLDLGIGQSNEERIFLQTDMQSVKAATIILSTIPIAVIYPFVSKHFTKGVMLGAVKG